MQRVSATRRRTRRSAGNASDSGSDDGADLGNVMPILLRDFVDERLVMVAEDDNYPGVVQGTPKMEVQCPNFHKLTRVRFKSGGWACDAFQKRNARYVKSRFGIKDSEPWHCLSKCTGFDQLDGKTSYRCDTCDFDLCVKCYARADKAMVKLRKVAEVLSSAQKVEWSQSKLMVVGEGRAGKTSTVRTLLGERFIDNLPSTVGAAVTYAQSNTTRNWNEITAHEKEDVAVEAAVRKLKEEKSGQGGSRSRSRLNVLKGDAMTNVITAAKALRKGARRKTTERSKTSERSKQAKKAPQRKQMQKKRQVQKQKRYSEVAQVAGNMKLELLGRSLREMRSIKYRIWDYGGQEVFYSLHHLFLTQYGIYLIVFNLERYLDDREKSEAFLSYWLQSIRLHADEAPILLVGTHADNLANPREGFEEVNKRIGESFAKFTQVQHNKRTGLRYIPLSNRTQDGIVELRKMLESCSRKQPFLYTKVSIRWLRCLDRLQARDDVQIGLSDARAIARGEGVMLPQEVGVMLELFHKLGVLIHFTSTVALEKIIVLSPQWLIDQVGKVIRDPTLHKYDMDAVVNAGLEDDLKSLQATSVATLDLLTFFWGKQMSAFLVDLLRRTMLLSEWPYAAQGEKAYFVPSLLKDVPVLSVEGERCKLTFAEGFLPDGVFQRLVCLGLEFIQSSNKYPTDREHPPQISQTCAVLSADSDRTFCLTMENHEIIVTSTPPDRALFYSFVVQRLMGKVNEDVMGAGLKWEIQYFDKEKNMYVSEKDARDRRVPPWFGKPISRDATKEQESRLDIDRFVDALS